MLNFYFQRYFLVWLAGLITFMAMWGMVKLPDWRWFVVLLAVWLFFLIYLNNFKNKGIKNFWQTTPLLIFTVLAGVSLLVLLESKYWQWLVIVLEVCLVMFLLFLSGEAKGLTYEKKPVRRTLLMIWTFDLFAFWAGFFALSLFFTQIPFWLLILLGSLLTGYISLLIWRLYFSVSLNKLFLPAVIIFLAVWELAWVIHLLPLGYLVLAMLLVWAWYVGQLLLRFQMSVKGIIWQKQTVFLFSNLVLYFIFLFFFVRWL